MNNVDHDQSKFYRDSHGNLIPKNGIPADETYGKDVKPDHEIMDEYGLEE